MKENPLWRLGALGQSVWLDFLSRHALVTGELRRLVEEDAVVGVTSNPAIFEKAIVDSPDYDAAIRELTAAGHSSEEIYEALVVDDIRHACDLLGPVYDPSDGRDGLVSLEVSPHLARDTDGTIDEARRLWRRVERPNLMIKVPGTRQGLPAIHQLLAEGINVNITLLFGLDRYRAVAETYLAALESRATRGEPVARIASVASFFLSRIDVLVDPRLEKLAREGGPHAGVARSLRGKTAIACAKVAYSMYEEIFAGQRFARLVQRGARSQRLLWASTSTKNPHDPDTMYVEPLIGPETINTLPLETLRAYRDHGDPAPRLTQGRPEAHQTLAQLAEAGVELDEVSDELEEQGIAKFVAPFDKILQGLREKHDVFV